MSTSEGTVKDVVAPSRVRELKLRQQLMYGEDLVAPSRVRELKRSSQKYESCDSRRTFTGA